MLQRIEQTAYRIMIVAEGDVSWVAVVSGSQCMTAQILLQYCNTLNLFPPSPDLVAAHISLVSLQSVG